MNEEELLKVINKALEKSPEIRMKYAAEGEKALAEARLADAQAEKERMANRTVLCAAETAEMALERELLKRKKELADDEHFHTYRFTGKVNEGSVKTCMVALAVWHRTEPNCQIEIVFSSPGGDIIDGMALFDYIQFLRGSGHKIITKSLGYAASMAGILLQAGDVRIMSSESYLLIHEAQFGAIGTFGEVEDTVEFIKKIQDRILSIFATRSTLTKAQIRARWHRKNWWLSSDEALKLGFIDFIEGKYEGGDRPIQIASL